MFGRECDFSGRFGSARVLDGDTVYAVDATCVGGENPEGLQLVVVIERATAIGAGICADVNQHATEDGFANVFADRVGDWTADTVDFVAADLTSGDPRRRSTEAGRSFRSLRLEDLHKSGDGTEIGLYGNFLLGIFKCIEAKGDFSGVAVASGFDRHDRTGHSCTVGDPSTREWDVLHDAGRNALAGLGVFGGKAVIEAHGQYCTAWNGEIGVVVILRMTRCGCGLRTSGIRTQ